MEHPIIIVGAGRSGTKILRGILNSHPKLVCFPREINYIWRHGNVSYRNDELKPEHARKEVKEFIRSIFCKYGSSYPGKRIIEKTCANSLRIGFVKEIFPHSFIVHIIRDGRAVSESARRMWKSTPRIKYLVEKLRWVPLGDLPYYFFRYLGFQVNRFSNVEKMPSSWGPRFGGMDELYEMKKIIEICALQWKYCVEKADDALLNSDNNYHISIKYEDMIRDPVTATTEILNKAGLEIEKECIQFIDKNVQKDYLNLWQSKLNANDMRLIMQNIEGTLTKYGYE